MSDATENLQRRLERQTNELIGQIHVQETLLLIMLRKLLVGLPDPKKHLGEIKAETVEMISQTKSLSGDAQDTQRIRETHALLAEQFFQPLEEYFSGRR